ncbi:hypothetical protein GLOTRDRAFT_101857, partial [Gloeophyllum trabeum ATCC 11539]
LKSNVFRSPRIVPPRHKPTRPPKPDPGVGDLWLRTADLSPANALLFQHGDFASELVFCEMFMLRIPLSVLLIRSSFAPATAFRCLACFHELSALFDAAKSKQAQDSLFGGF